MTGLLYEWQMLLSVMKAMATPKVSAAQEQVRPCKPTLASFHHSGLANEVV